MSVKLVWPKRNHPTVPQLLAQKKEQNNKADQLDVWIHSIELCLASLQHGILIAFFFLNTEIIQDMFLN